MLESDTLCEAVLGCSLAEAERLIKINGGTSRVVQDGSRLLLDAITSDFNESRFNLRIEQGKVKHARIG